jgi:PAS domain S-box-containing protein
LAPSYDKYLRYVHPDDRENADNVHKEALKGKPFSMDHRIILSHGEERTIHMQTEVIFDGKNIPIKLKGTVQDVTERKRVEEQLLESEGKYRNIVETANEGIAILDSEGKHTYVNKKLSEMLGYSEEELCGKFVKDLAEDSNAFKKRFEKRSRGVSESYELKLIRKDGSFLWVLVNAKALFDTNGRFIGSLSMITDITELQKAEEALKFNEITRKKEIHHRIKNNLQVISSLLDLQAEKFRNRTDIENSEVLDAFIESQNRIASMSLIHEELYKGRAINTLNFSSYVKELTDNLLLTYRLKTDVSINFELEENIFLDMDTAIPLGLIINELVSNSLKYAFPGREKGEILIKLHREEKGECKNEGCKSTSFVLSVSDNGIGIPKDLTIEDLDSLGLQLVTSLVDS